MATRHLDGETLNRMLHGGAVGIRNEIDTINGLIVFPVPDGDTGTNMTRTVESGLKHLPTENASVGDIAGEFAKGALFGARGNSGVILSQYIAGVSDALNGKKTVSTYDLVEATKEGVARAYAAIAKPVEGTILTVLRESMEYVSSHVTDETSVEELMKLGIEQAKRTLVRTKEILPALREADVVDSGGAGYLCIIIGMYRALVGELTDSEITFETEEKKPEINYDLFTTDSVLEWGYCTECLVRLQRAKIDPESFDRDEVIEELEKHSANSIVLLRNGDVVKLHAHTKTPSDILTLMQKYGEFLEVKIENMSLGHNEKIKEEQPVCKKYSLVTVSTGEGLSALFKSLGADVVVNGGQTANPSAEDFVKAYESSPAEDVFVLPNNGNVLLAAVQSAELWTHGRVHVIPTKTVAEGYAALSVYNTADEDADAIEADMTDAAKSVNTVEIAKSIRDVTINGVDVKRGEYIAILDGEIKVSDQSIYDTVLRALHGIEDIDEREIVTVFVGEGVTEEVRATLTERMEDEFPEISVEVYISGQPVYDFIISVE